jgi:hypothetical protein
LAEAGEAVAQFEMLLHAASGVCFVDKSFVFSITSGVWLALLVLFFAICLIQLWPILVREKEYLSKPNTKLRNNRAHSPEKAQILNALPP